MPQYSVGFSQERLAFGRVDDFFLNANYSFKYLGKDKGVSVVTFVDMLDFTWHSTVISSSEREAAYVIDGLMHNE